MRSETRVVPADDHPIFRLGLKHVIENQPGFTVVAEAESGRTALELVVTYSPAVAVLDLDMPDLDGVAVARRVRDLELPTRLVAYITHRPKWVLMDVAMPGMNGLRATKAITAQFPTACIVVTQYTDAQTREAAATADDDRTAHCDGPWETGLRTAPHEGWCP